MKDAFERPLESTDLRTMVVEAAHNHLENYPYELMIQGASNSGPWVRAYMDGNDGSPWFWCMGFVQAIIDQAEWYLEEPEEPADTASNLEKKKWELKLKQFIDREQELEDTARRISSEVWGRCTESMKAKLKGVPRYHNFNTGQKLINLLFVTPVF